MRRKIRPARCPDDGAAVDLTVYIAQPRNPSEPATIQSIPNMKACRSCQHIYTIIPPKKSEVTT